MVPVVAVCSYRKKGTSAVSCVSGGNTGNQVVWEGCVGCKGYTFIHSGRPLPSGEEPAERNEGVGIALDETATAAWKAAGEVWDVSSRIVTARLKFTNVGQRRPGGSRETRNSYISVVSVSAKAPTAIVKKFMDNLQDTVDKIPASDVLILLGDFNARIGSGGDDDLWLGVRSRHGVGVCNEAG